MPAAYLPDEEAMRMALKCTLQFINLLRGLLIRGDGIRSQGYPLNRVNFHSEDIGPVLPLKAGSAST